MVVSRGITIETLETLLSSAITSGGVAFQAALIRIHP